MRPLYIFDLDGTLALIEHRRHHVERPLVERSLLFSEDDPPAPKWKPNWKQFYLDCVNDQPNLPVIQTMNLLLDSGAEVRIFSGRSDEVEGLTMIWLSDHCRFLENRRVTVRMRREGDYTPDDVLKAQWLSEMTIYDRDRLVAVFEDRDRLVRMWRSRGIACFQVAPGDF